MNQKLALGLIASITLIVITNLLAHLNLYWSWMSYDSWNLYSQYIEFGTPAYFFFKYYGHPMILPKLIFTGELNYLSGTYISVIWLGVASYVLCSALLIHALWRDLQPATPWGVKCAFASLLAGGVFWLTRSYELALPFLIGSTLVATLMTVAAYALSRHLQHQHARHPGWPSDFWWWLMCGGCVLATFTTSAGAAVWPGIGLTLLLYRVKIQRVLLFALIGILALTGTFLMPTGNEPVPLSAVLEMLPSAGTAFQYFTIFLGGALNFSLFPQEGGNTGVPLLSGILGAAGTLTLCIYTWRLYRRQAHHTARALPLALGWFAIFTALAATIGRAGIDMTSNPVAGFYTTWSVLLWLALLWLALSHLGETGLQSARGRAAFAALGMGCLLIFASASYHGLNFMLEEHRNNQIGGLSMIVAPQKRAADARRLMFLNPQPVFDNLPHMRARRHNLFFEAWTQQLGAPLSKHYAILDDAGCFGVWRERSAWRRNDSRIYEGWAHSPSGNFDTVLFTSAGVIIGGAKPTWIGDPTKLDPQRELPGPGRHLLGVLLGYHSGWLGVADTTMTANTAEIEAYGVLDTHTVCQLSDPDPGGNQ